MINFSPRDKLDMMQSYIKRGRGHAGGLVAAIEDLVNVVTVLALAMEVISRNQLLLLDDPGAGKVLKMYDTLRGVGKE